MGRGRCWCLTCRSFSAAPRHFDCVGLFIRLRRLFQGGLGPFLGCAGLTLTASAFSGAARVPFSRGGRAPWPAAKGPLAALWIPPPGGLGLRGQTGLPELRA